MAIRREQLQCFDCSQNYYKNVTYQNVAVANYYRTQRPYRLFTQPGVSAVTITFGLSGAENVSRIVLSLNHCRTTADGVVTVAVNGTMVIPNLQAPRDNFGKESFNLDACHFKPESNVLTIQLRFNSPGVYWLSDATINVERQVDETEDDIDKIGRDTFVNLKKFLIERRKTIENLRKIAADLDELHQTINKVKIGGGVARLGGWLLMLGGAALEIVSEGTATPVVAAMEEYGWTLVIGGTVIDGGASAWDAIKNLAEVESFEKNIADDKRYCDKMVHLETSLRSQVIAQQDVYRNKYPSLAGSSVGQLMTARLMMSASTGDSFDFAKMFSKDGFETCADVFKVVEVDVLEQILRVGASAVGAVLTIADLMEKLAEISKGSPSEMANHIRTAADELEEDISSIQSFLQDSLNAFLESLNKELRSSNILSASKIMNVLSIFDGINSRYGPLNMTWLNHWNNFESTLQSELLATLTNALNQLYQELECELSRRQQEESVDLVIIAHGSIGAPGCQEAVPLPGMNQACVIPSQMCFATDYLSSVTFNQPWGVLIDARANYGIVSGSITPDQTRFQGVGHPASIPNRLTRFNVLQSGSGEIIPNVWCNENYDNDAALRELLEYINARPTSRPFVWWRIGSMPSFFITSLASIAAMLLSIGRTRIDLRIHHAQCLNWPSINEPPPQLMTLDQYYNAVGETYRQPFKMIIT